eukprot:SAG31_NODE_1682_length_7537_cov_4.810164_2_plen_47_part_00
MAAINEASQHDDSTFLSRTISHKCPRDSVDSRRVGLTSLCFAANLE